MTNPVFVGIEQVLRAHDRSLAEHGGTSGLREEGLLRAAVDQPINDFLYAGADAFGIAAAYAYHIAQAQACLDGNKRTAMAAALIFLEANGIHIPPASDRLYESMMAIAERSLSKAELATVFRELFA